MKKVVSFYKRYWSQERAHTSQELWAWLEILVSTPEIQKQRLKKCKLDIFMGTIFGGWRLQCGLVIGRQTSSTVFIPFSTEKYGEFGPLGRVLFERVTTLLPSPVPLFMHGLMLMHTVNTNHSPILSAKFYFSKVSTSGILCKPYWHLSINVFPCQAVLNGCSLQCVHLYTTVVALCIPVTCRDAL